MYSTTQYSTLLVPRSLLANDPKNLSFGLGSSKK
jgi:hypothetical protein